MSRAACDLCLEGRVGDVGARFKLRVCDACARKILQLGYADALAHAPIRIRVKSGLPSATRHGREYLNQQLSTREQVRQRDRGRCRYCGTGIEPMTYDHVIPKCQGGAGTMDNLVLACQACNQEKGGRTPEEAGMLLLPIPGPEVPLIVRGESEEREGVSAPVKRQEVREQLIAAEVLRV